MIEGRRKMSDKGMIIRECKSLNASRRVFEGRIDSTNFFRTIRGDLLLTGGEARNQTLILDLIWNYLERKDIPTIILTSRLVILEGLQQELNKDKSMNVILSYPNQQNYHPFYGMSKQQFLRFIRMTAEEMGYSILMDQVMIYAAAVLEVVAMKYPISLPAVVNLLNEDDVFISEIALQEGLSNVIADNIRANHEAGIVVRRLLERLEEIIEDIYISGSDTKYNLQSGVKGNLFGMVMYACSSNQAILNSYLKEEVFYVLKYIPKVRIILDEMEFVDKDDEFMKYLSQLKRQQKIELVVVSQNIKDSTYGKENLDFSNIVMFLHGSPGVTDNISRDLFGTYQYHKPVPVVVKPPHFFPTFKKSVQWQIQSEERLRVRNEDFCVQSAILGKLTSYLAVKTTANENVYLIRISDFIPSRINVLPVI